MKSALEPMLVPTPVLAALLKISPRRVQQLAQEGIFASSGHGLWDALECVPAATEHRLQSEIARLQRTPGEERVRDLRAEEIELRLEERSRVLINEARAEALAIVDEFAGPLRSDLMSIPARVTKDLALRKQIETKIDEAFGAASKRAATAADDYEAAETSPAPNRAARRAARHGRPAR